MKGNKHTGQYCYQCNQELTSWDLRCSKAVTYQNPVCEQCIAKEYDLSSNELREIMETFFGMNNVNYLTREDKIISWFAVSLSLIGNILINYQRRLGFVVWTAGNAIWIALALTRRDHAQVCLFSVYIVLNIHGFFTWKRGFKIENKGHKGGRKDEDRGFKSSI